MSETVEEILIAAAGRLREALAAEPHANADAEAEYASDQLAIAARNLVRHVEASRQAESVPAGWDDDPVDGTPDDPSWRAHRVFVCGRCETKWGTNCETGTIACPDCEARLCSGCGRWEGEALDA